MTDDANPFGFLLTGQRPEPKQVNVAANAEELVDRFRRMADPAVVPFRPGDVLVEKEGLRRYGTFRPMLLVRPLDLTAAIDRKLINYWHAHYMTVVPLDVLVMIATDSDSVVFHPHSTTFLRRYDPAIDAVAAPDPDSPLPANVTDIRGRLN
jgi:hypothetical protein